MKIKFSEIQPKKLLIFLVTSMLIYFVFPTIQGLILNALINHRNERKTDGPSYSDLEGRVVVYFDNVYFVIDAFIDNIISGTCRGRVIGRVSLVDGRVSPVRDGGVVQGVAVSVVVDGIVGGTDAGGDLLPINPVINPEASLQNKSAQERLKKIDTMCDTIIKDSLDIALEELQTSLSFDNKYGETYYLLAYTYIKYGDHYTSVGDIPKAIDAYHRDSLNNIKEAERYNYDPYTNIFYEKGRVFSSLGAIYKNKLGNPSLAKEYFENAIAMYDFCLKHKYIYTKNVYPARSDAHYNLGLIHFKNKDYVNAAQQYEYSINDNHANYPSHYELARAYFFQQLWTKSIEQFDFIINTVLPNNGFHKLAIEGRDYYIKEIQRLKNQYPDKYAEVLEALREKHGIVK